MTLTRPDGRPFTTSFARLLENLPEREAEAPKPFARVRPGDRVRSEPFYAMVDTGAAWSVFHHELAESMGLFEGEGLGSRVVHTWMGRKEGALVKCPLVICSDLGPELRVDATVFACADWLGHNILGFSGLLANLNIAFDTGREGLGWHFGPND